MCLTCDMTTRLGRKLTDGLTARLEFDYACNRGHSFGEYYLHGTVNEIISANIDPAKMRVHAGFAHPAIARETPGRGRHPELDFYIKNRDGTPSNVCAEVKWADSSHSKVTNVLRDLLRLALVSQSEPSAECLFIFAGGNTHVESLLSTPPVAAASEDQRRLLERPRATRAPRKRAFQLVVGGKYVESISKEAEKFSSLPKTIYTTLVTPAAIGTKRWQALVWRVAT